MEKKENKKFAEEGDYTHRLSFTDLIKLSFRIFRTKLMRTLLTISGMSVGIGAVLFLVSLGYGLQFILIGRLVSTEDSLITLEAMLPSEVTTNITESNLKEIREIPESVEISPLAEFPGEIKVGTTTGVVLVNIVANNFFRLSGLKPEVGGTFSEGLPGVVASSQSMTLLGLENSSKSLNKKFEVTVSYYDQGSINVTEINAKQKLSLLGIRTDDVQTIIIPAEAMPVSPPYYQKVLVKAKDIDGVLVLKDKLQKMGYLITAKVDFVNQAKKIMNIITIVLGVFGITALFVAAIGMFNTMIVGFLERIYEVGIMKSLGATDKDIQKLFLMESSIMGLAGGLGGIFLGWTVGKLSNYGLSVLSKRLGGEVIEIFITPLWFMGLIIVISLLIGLIAGFWPSRQASSLSPKQAFLKK